MLRVESLTDLINFLVLGIGLLLALTSFKSGDLQGPRVVCLLCMRACVRLVFSVFCMSAVAVARDMILYLERLSAAADGHSLVAVRILCFLIMLDFCCCCAICMLYAWCPVHPT